MSKENHNHIRLLAAMNGDPESWEYRGEEIDSENNEFCACGHSIRFVYPMYHKVTGKMINIGSTCIETAPFMPNGMVAQYLAFLEAKKAELKRQLELQRQVEVAAMRKELYLAINAAKQLYHARYADGSVPRYWSGVISAAWAAEKVLDKKLKTPKGMLNSMKPAMRKLELSLVPLILEQKIS